MKALFLILALTGATVLTGCNGVAVVESGPRYGHTGYGYASTQVYYDDDRPYYYYGGARRWGYPSGYYGHRSGYYGGGGGYAHVDVERNVENNYNRTVYNRNVKKVYANNDRNRPNYNYKAKTTNVQQRPPVQQRNAKPTTVKYKQQPVRRVENQPKAKGDDEKTTNKKGKGRA